MSVRDYVRKLDDRGDLVKVTAPISKAYEIAGVLKKLEPKPVLFECVKESAFRVMGNLFCSKAAFAAYFGIQANEIIPFLVHAIDQRFRLLQNAAATLRQSPASAVVTACAPAVAGRLPVVRPGFPLGRTR